MSTAEVKMLGQILRLYRARAKLVEHMGWTTRWESFLVPSAAGGTCAQRWALEMARVNGLAELRREWDHKARVLETMPPAMFPLGVRRDLKRQAAGSLAENLNLDAEPLFGEGLKVLALKAAVYEHTSDDKAAELLVSSPVDEMVHANIAQAGLCKRIFDRVGISCVHQTDHEQFGWSWGDYTNRCYIEAGWGTPPARYWIDADETHRRRAVLNQRYQSVGIGATGASTASTSPVHRSLRRPWRVKPDRRASPRLRRRPVGHRRRGGRHH